MIEKLDQAEHRVRVRQCGREACRIEPEIDTGKQVLFLSNVETRSLTLGEALEHDRDEKTAHKAGPDQERNRIAGWLARPLAGKMFHQVVPGDLESYLTRLATAAPCLHRP